MLQPVLRGLWYALAALVVAAALALSVARLTLPMLEARAGQLEAVLQEMTGEDVRVGHLEVGWRRFGPEVRIHDFALRDRGTTEELLSARELRIDFDVVRSLVAWRPVPARLVLLGSEVRLYRTAEGRLAVEGVHLKRSDSRPWPTVLAQPHVELRDIRVHWHDALGQIPDLVVDDVDLRMRNRGRRHQLEVGVQLPAAYGGRLQMAADLSGAGEQPLEWTGAMHLAIDRAPFAEWLAPYLRRWRLEGAGRGAVWLWIEDGAIRRARGTLDLDNPRVAVRADPEASPEAPADAQDGSRSLLFAAERIGTRFEWRNAEAGWTLSLEQLRLRQDGVDQPVSGLTVAVDADDGDTRRVRAAVDHLRLETAAPLLAQLSGLGEAQRELLRELRPGGELRNVQIGFARRADRIEDLVWRLDFQGVHNAAAGKLPGTSALRGSVAGDAGRGVLRLDSRDARLALPRLFREPLALGTLSGRVDWRRLPDRLRIESARLVAANPDLRTQSRVRLDIPFDGTRPLLDLQTDFADGRVESAYKYLPVGIMPPRTVAWLDRALVSGQVTSGAALFQGRLGDFPFDAATGRMEVRAGVTDAVLDYHEGWHRIEGLTAELAFVNRGMHIRGVAGTVLGSELRDVEVRIDDLAHAHLVVDGRAQGPLADMLRVLADSPLGGDEGGGFTEHLGLVRAEGEARLQLGLRIPLAARKPPKVEGRVRLEDNGLALPEWDVALEQLAGELRFTEDSVDGGGLQGRLFGAPVALDVATETAGRGRVTRVRAQGDLPLLERVPAEAGFVHARFKGASAWTATLQLPRNGGPGARARIELESDLRGVAIDLPEPLGKTAASARPVRFGADIAARALGAMTLHYGGHSAAFELARRDGGMRLERAELRLNNAGARLPKEPGLQIRGSLPAFDWDVWRRLFDGGAPAALVGAADAGPQLRRLDVDVGELTALGRRFTAVQLEAFRDAAGLEAEVAGPQVQGTIRVPVDPTAPLRLRLARLHLPAAAAAGAGTTVDPAKLPSLDLEVQDMRFRDLALGRVALRTHPIATGLAVDAAKVTADWARFNATGQWTQRAGRDASRFRIDVQGGELGKLLAAFGYAGSIAGGEMAGEIDANWQGTPADFKLANLEGSLEARIGKGRLLNVEAGAGRVFGLFSLQSLRRRLALDFSDVFEKGFSFDRIDGKFSLIDGDAYTNDLVVEGPSARIEISGRTGLAAQDYDQLVTVVPQVQSSLPIAGAIAGGPVVGAALLLADKLFARQMEDLTRFARHQYTVTGSWDDPQVRALPREPARGLQNPDSTSADE